MFSSNELLTKFRALGGIADNVDIRLGRHGYGLYTVDPNRASRLVTPAQLLIAPSLLQIAADGQIRVKPGSGLSAEVVAFHEQYQRSFGWGSGGFEYISRYREQLQALPETLKAFLQILGCRDDLSRQLTPLEAFQHHCISRQIGVEGVSKLMPVMELANHASNGEPYVVSRNGVSLTGTFDDEVLARYRQSFDAFHFFFNYHFFAPARSTLSCDVRIDVPDFGSLRISRKDGLSDVRGGARWPQFITGKDEFHLSFVELVNLDAPPLPRQVFAELLKQQGLPITRSHELFDGLIAHNRQVLLDFLIAFDGLDGPVLLGLKEVAASQLTNLLQA